MLLSVPYLMFAVGACNASRMTRAVPSVQGQFATLVTVVLVAAAAAVALPHLSAWRRRRESGS